MNKTSGAFILFMGLFLAAGGYESVAGGSRLPN